MSLTAQKWQDVMAMSTGVQYTLGPNATDRYLLGPRRLGFLFARYAVAAKVLRDCSTIIDIGCGDGMASAVLLEDTKAKILGIDMDRALIEHARKSLMPALKSARSDAARMDFEVCNFLDGEAVSGTFSGALTMDVIEHIEPAKSVDFIERLSATVDDNGIVVVGTPNALAAQYASPQSRMGHINLFDPDRLRREMKCAFRHVILVSMNDSVAHFGFENMAHYLIGVGFK